MTRDAWIDLPTEEAMRAEQPPGSPYDFGFVLSMGRLLRAHPRIGQPFVDLFSTIMFADGHLSRRERELVAAIAAAGQDCFY